MKLKHVFSGLKNAKKYLLETAVITIPTLGICFLSFPAGFICFTAIFTTLIQVPFLEGYNHAIIEDLDKKFGIVPRG